LSSGISKMKKKIKKQNKFERAINSLFNEESFSDYKIHGNYLIFNSWSFGNAALEFEELDQLLELLCPNISVLQYKKIIRQCCVIESCYPDRRYFKCNLLLLKEVLKELGYKDLDSEEKL
jgi:hypothetical protein